MELTLPQRIYLLSAYDPDKADFTATGLQFRGQRLRAAAFAVLVTDGLVRTDGKKAWRLAEKAPRDTFLHGVWDELPADKAQGWLRLVHNKAHTAETPVREQLREAGYVEEPHGHRLNPLAKHKGAPSDPGGLLALRERTRGPVLADALPEQVPDEDVTLAVLCAEGGTGALFTGKEQKAHEETLKRFGAHFDARVPGLRAALLTSILSARSVGGGWS
ncbi:GPP34 family phosphoprotein [Streptomyces sp. NPDC001054]